MLRDHGGLGALPRQALGPGLIISESPRAVEGPFSPAALPDAARASGLLWKKPPPTTWERLEASARAFLIGNSAGLSTRDLCEGIGPAVRSGLLAADAITSGGAYSLERVRAHSVKQSLVRRGLDWAFCGRA